VSLVNLTGRRIQSKYENLKQDAKNAQGIESFTGTDLAGYPSCPSYAASREGHKRKAHGLEQDIPNKRNIVEIT
jgi:hypothetical protein